MSEEHDALQEGYNAADEKQVKRRKRKVELVDEEHRRDLEAVLELPAGRRFIWDLLGICGVYRLSWSPDAARTAFAEGGRDIGLRLTKEITEHFPGLYLLMQDEAFQAAKKEKENG